MPLPHRAMPVISRKEVAVPGVDARRRLAGIFHPTCFMQWEYDKFQNRNLMRVESEHAPLLALGVNV